MDSSLDLSKTAVSDSHIVPANFSYPTTTENDKIEQVKGQKANDFNEKDIELNISSSNDTIRPELTSKYGKDNMFANDANLEFPEGGMKAYSVMLGCFFGFIPNFGLLNVVGVIQSHLIENQLQNVKSSTVAWIFSIFLFINFLTSIFSGTFFDRNGARIPLIAGSLLQVAGLVATANGTKVWHFILSFSILVGIGGGFSVSPLVGSIAHYFNRRRGLMTSISSAGGSVGGIIFPIILRSLFSKVGFSWAMRIFALICSVCYVLSVILVEERLPPKKTEGTRMKKVLSYLNAIDIKGLKDPKYFFTVLGCSFAEAAALIMATYQASYARANGCSVSTSYLMITLTNIGGLPGRWITGYLSDKIGRFNIMTLTLLSACTVLLVILVPFGEHHVASIYVFSVAWGFCTGSIFSLLPVCCGQISKTEEFGRRYGTMYFVVAFGTLCCIPIAGAIVGDGSPTGYRNMMIYTAVTSFCSSIFYVTARSVCVGFKLARKF